MCCGYQREERCSWQRNAPTARATSANAQTGVGRGATPQAKPPQNRQLHPRGVHSAGCRGAAEAGTRQTPRQSVYVPLTDYGRDVLSRFHRKSAYSVFGQRSFGNLQTAIQCERTKIAKTESVPSVVKPRISFPERHQISARIVRQLSAVQDSV